MEIYSIEEEESVLTNFDRINSNNHGHSHDNNEELLKEWIATFNGFCKEGTDIYDQNKTVFDYIFISLFILTMFWIVYSIFGELYSLYQNKKLLEIVKRISNPMPEKTRKKAE